MARPRAADHGEKRGLILDHAAELFAAHGFDRTSLTLVATACGMSKGLLYHYYADKSQLLFDIIHGHLRHLLDVTAVVDAAAGPRAHLIGMSEALLEAYRTSDSRHHIQLNQMRLLPEAQQAALRDMERALVARVAAALAPCVPADAALLKPLTMSLFGMLNWNYLWFRDGGAMSRSDYARLAVTLVVEGASRLPIPDRSRRRSARSSAAPDT